MFPWVKRARLDASLAEVSELRRLRAEDARVIAEYRGARDAVQAALERSEAERKELTVKLLRVGFGYPPFDAPTLSPAPQAAEATEPQPQLNALSSAEEVRRAFLEEGYRLYGGDVRKLMRHIERRQAEFYEGRTSPAVVAADIESAISEGVAAAGVN